MIVAKNLVNRNFKANKPNEKWTTDVSQFNFPRGKCYLSPTMDMYNNEIIGYDLSLNPNFSQIERMLDSIVFTGKDISNLVFHSDQGRQYQNPRFVAFLKNKNIMQSMSRKGNCFDNSIMESFFGIMKNEIYYGKENTITNFNHFKFIIDEYMRYYNNKRIKKQTGYHLSNTGLKMVIIGKKTIAKHGPVNRVSTKILKMHDSYRVFLCF